MKLERVVTTPDNYAPFLLSQGIRFGNLLFISGQAGAGENGNIVEGGSRAQGKQAFANLRRALEAGGSSLDDVIKVTIFITDMGNFKEVVELRREFFSEPYPADTIAEVKALYNPEVMIEIEAIGAVRDGEETGKQVNNDHLSGDDTEFVNEEREADHSLINTDTVSSSSP